MQQLVSKHSLLSTTATHLMLVVIVGEQLWISNICLIPQFSPLSAWQLLYILFISWVLHSYEMSWHPAYNTYLLYVTLLHSYGTFSHGWSSLHMGCNNYCELQMISIWTFFPLLLLDSSSKTVLIIPGIYS